LHGKILERDLNLGLSRSIVAGVSELTEEYGRVIVIEDDFLVSPWFLDYMITALDRYADQAQVYQISGYMFPVEHARKPDAFFLPLTTTWGWGTWDRAWKIFDWDATGAIESLRDPDLRRQFELDGSYPYASMLEQRLRNENDSWGILFLWAVFNVGGLVLHPRESLIWVGGFDRSGTHCGDQGWSREASVESVTEGSRQKILDLPESVVPDDAAFDRIKAFLRKETSGKSIIQRVRQKLARLSRSAVWEI
jgi:GT2 family glycosyltransferase